MSTPLPSSSFVLFLAFFAWLQFINKTKIPLISKQGPSTMGGGVGGREGAGWVGIIKFCF